MIQEIQKILKDELIQKLNNFKKSKNKIDLKSVKYQIEIIKKFKEKCKKLCSKSINTLR